MVPVIALVGRPNVGKSTLFNQLTKSRDALVANFSEQDGQGVKNIEATTNHDVKAVEYFLKEKFQGNSELEAVRRMRRTSKTFCP